MSGRRTSGKERPRELRRRVVVPARLRLGASWSDACILNISSRGLMIHSRQPLALGTRVEIRRGEHVIIARVMWRDGAKAGLEAEERVAVEEIMVLGQGPAYSTSAPAGERRTRPRLEQQSRLRGRAFEFVGVVVIGASLAGTGFAMAERAFARPLAIVSAALGH
jgi:hypothetical protein